MENLNQPMRRLLNLRSLKAKHDYFEVQNLETRTKRHENSHHWLPQINYKLPKSNKQFFSLLYSLKILYHISKFSLFFV